MFVSTRNSFACCFQQVALSARCPNGGLYIPASFPTISNAEIISLVSQPYYMRAHTICSKFQKNLDINIFKESYHFSPQLAAGRTSNEHILELFHGPTGSFKDLSLAPLPKIIQARENTLIIVATSGNTGGAALEAFKDDPNISMIVIYPCREVSRAQAEQMQSYSKYNKYNIIAHSGSFDDCQLAVKNLLKTNKQATTVNSVNWARILFQIPFAFSAYADLINKKKLKAGDQIDVAVPTGNFGNILSVYYARKMGLPVRYLIPVSNENKTLYRFLTTGVMFDQDARRTSTPAIDIAKPSNLERLLYDIDKEDLKRYIRGKFISEKTVTKIERIFLPRLVCDDKIALTMKETKNKYDPHTACALSGVDNLDDFPRVIFSTAHPNKFI